MLLMPDAPDAEPRDDVLPGDARDETVNERADRNWNEILQELRVTQTGTQIISGFLLAVAFQSRFTELDAYQLALYMVLVGLAAVATVLGLAPVVLHRAHFARRRKPRIVELGGRLMIADLVVIALLTCGVASLIFDFVLGRVAGVTALGAGLLVVLIAWVLVPRAAVSTDHRS